MTFYKWLSKRYGKENNQFQKLVLLFESNADSPKRAKKKKTVRRYLKKKNADSRLVGAFNAAHKKYESEVLHGN